ncbi:hypothetical protein LJ737_20055 [Hymenobacter sp. 15J16-1T3B]|uniref:hypothetical protein n=1 Tax=Hymenobacter sp. 15J16-1T3B TaxID=2886941 RepID=UPI001D12A659|nr:hypothetical protein [Hymenobacter sp. 15J16-1T3B]MCC3159546.1 hypothetical protein [Hymenobacter sp. 15J16-1T3B]
MNTSTLRSFFATLLPAGALLLSLGACSTSHYVLVKPAAGNSQWQDGLQMVAANNDSVDVRLGVASTAGPWLEFDVTVHNRSRRPVRVAPEAFYLDAYSATPGIGALRVQAENPEQNIQALQQQAAYHQQKSAARPAAEMLSSLSNLLDDLSSRPRHENAARRTARQTRYQSEMARYEQERASHAVQATAARDQQRQLETTLLRRTTLAPGAEQRGRVRFRRYSDTASRLRVVMPVGGRALAADFTQQRFRLDAHPVATAPAAGRRN